MYKQKGYKLKLIGKNELLNGCIKVGLVVGLGGLALSAALLTGCSADKTETGSVAAEAYGEKIYENYVTSVIEAKRAQNDADGDDAAWSKYMEQNNTSPVDLREEVINERVAQIRTEKLAADYNISISDKEVEDEVKVTKKDYKEDSDWKNYLKTTGQTEKSFTYQIKTSMLESKMIEAHIGAPSYDEIDETAKKNYIKMYSNSIGESKRLSVILLEKNKDSSDETVEKANSIIAEINSGKSFEDAVQEYSVDEKTKKNQGDLGWTSANEDLDYVFLSASQNMKPGDVSAPLDYSDDKSVKESDDSDPANIKEYVAIIKCTDSYTFPTDNESLDGVPEGLANYIKDKVVEVEASSVYSQLSSDKLTESNLRINEMPSGLSYQIK